MKKIIFLLLTVSFISMPTWAQSAFRVEHIQVDGLSRISSSTVENYLPIKRGQTFSSSSSAKILRALYKTGFFEQVTISRRNNTLVIHVVERPTIGQLTITGNSVLPTDKLTSVMRSVDIAEGRVYNPAVLERIKQSLLSQYYQLGRYNARVEVRVSEMPRNRVSILIRISEGLISKIQRITIIGNNAFSESTLTKQLEMTTSGLFTFFTQTDRYSEARLEQSSEKLRGFYLDHGYLQVNIKSAQAQVTPDRKSVFVTFVIEEGMPYTIERYDIEGKLLFPKEEFEKRVLIKPGETFSRQKLLDSQKAMTEFLGDNGYAYSTISLKPKINDKTRTVIIIFDIQPGRRTYVRNVTFSDNNRTNDVVLRREIMQMEAAPVSTSKLKASKHRLSLLPYIKNVDMTMKPVADIDDQVDVNYKVEENNSAEASAKIGYSATYGFMYGVGLNQKNFFGTGNTFGININRSRYEQFLGIDYTNPYYTEDGISRSLNLSISHVDPGATAFQSNAYTTNQLDLGVLYGIPIGQEPGVFSRIYAGATYQNIQVNLNHDHPENVSYQIQDFINQHGRRYNELDLRVGYSRDSRDRALFPTSGSLQTAFIDIFSALGSQGVSYYTLNYHGRWYQPLVNDFIFTSRADLGYGNGFHGVQDYPFFKNYFAGGIDAFVSGYAPLSLGPRDSLGQAFGGNMLVSAGAGIIFPNYISDNLRTTLFVDAGNVYSSLNMRNYGCSPSVPYGTPCSTNSGPIRYAAGIEADFFTPFGPVRLTLATPINIRVPPDKKDIFQFALSSNF